MHRLSLYLTFVILALTAPANAEVPKRWKFSPSCRLEKFNVYGPAVDETFSPWLKQLESKFEAARKASDKLKNQRYGICKFRLEPDGTFSDFVSLDIVQRADPASQGALIDFVKSLAPVSVTNKQIFVENYVEIEVKLLAYPTYRLASRLIKKSSKKGA